MDRRKLHERIAESLGWRKRWAQFGNIWFWTEPSGAQNELPDFDTDESANALLRDALLQNLEEENWIDIQRLIYRRVHLDKQEYKSVVVDVYVHRKGLADEG